MYFFWDFLKEFKNHFIPSHENDHQPHLLRRAYLLVFLALILTAEGLFVANLLGRSVDELAAVIQSELIAFTNDERADFSLTTLAENEVLNQAALAKARDMAAKGYFSHNGPDGKLPWEWISEAGYRYAVAGENLAVRFVDSHDVVEAWMDSPTHRANILKEKYKEIGIGIAEGTYQGSRATYVVQFFATPKAVVLPELPPVPSPVSQPEPQETVEPEPDPAPEQAPEAPQPLPQVAAAEVSSASPFTHTLERFFARLITDPRSSSGWILGAVAGIVIVALFFTFVVHIQIQHGRLLLTGSLVALFALSLMALNSHYLKSELQTASVANSSDAGVVLDDYAHWVELE